MFIKPAIQAYVKPDVYAAQFPGLRSFFLNVLLLIKKRPCLSVKS